MTDGTRGSLRSLREGNRDRLLGLLREHGALHRAELARRAGISRSTVSTIVSELLRDGLIVETDSSGRGGGLTLNPRAGAVVGFDFSADGVSGVLADLGHEVIGEAARSYAPDLPWAECLELGIRLADELLERSGLAWSRVLGVGVGVPGPVDQRTGELAGGARSPGWNGARPTATLTQRLGLPVAVANTAKVGALAEVTWGAARGCRDVIYLKLAAGVSAGLILDGKPFGGVIGAAGGIGHLPVVPDGPLCTCGGRGCLQLYTAVPALLASVQPMCGVLTVEEFLAKAAAGHRPCQRVLYDAASTLGRALGGVCNLLAPELVVVGGELAGAGEPFFTPLREALDRHAVPIVGSELRVVSSELGSRAGALGGVALALRTTGGRIRPPAA